jgi:putative ABC transport system permease protein
VRIDSAYYQVVGVDYAAGNMNINGRAEESVTVPISLVQHAYNRGNDIDLICATAKRGPYVEDFSPHSRSAWLCPPH